jgi:hypothetical protein
MVRAEADPATVERVLTETGVATAMPSPSWTEYAEAIVYAMTEAFTGALAPVGAAFVAYGWLAMVLTVALILAIGAWLIALALRLADERRRAGASRASGVTTEAGAPVAPRDARAWRRELERRLDEGQVGPALEALWWWFACSAAGTSEVERSCTSRELVRRAGRPDLGGPAGELDRWLYGPRAPAVSELRVLLRRAEQVMS